MATTLKQLLSSSGLYSKKEQDADAKASFYDEVSDQARDGVDSNYGCNGACGGRQEDEDNVSSPSP